MEYKAVIVGCGITGITIAQRLATSLKAPVMIIEKRSHIGGNLYDYYDAHGILVQKYGPHIFHTNNEQVWKYLSTFTTWNNYEHRVKAYVDKKLISIPINLQTMRELYDWNFNKEEMQAYLQNVAVKIPLAHNAKEFILTQVGWDLYNKIYKNYTYKQWGIDASELDASVLNRLPIRLNNDDRYFTDQYQGVPIQGYTYMMENMLDNDNIEVVLDADYRDMLLGLKYKYLIYTGKLDEYFGYKYGHLKYRSLIFENEQLKQEWYQLVGTINYPNDYKFTRITEYKHLTKQQSKYTTIMREYPCAEGEPYYPMQTIEMKKLAELYRSEAKQQNTYFVGRLAEYKYYNIDQAVEQGLECAREIIAKEEIKDE